MVRRARSQKGVIFDEIGRPGGCFLIGTRYNHPERVSGYLINKYPVPGGYPDPGKSFAAGAAQREGGPREVSQVLANWCTLG